MIGMLPKILLTRRRLLIIYRDKKNKTATSKLLKPMIIVPFYCTNFGWD